VWKSQKVLRLLTDEATNFVENFPTMLTVIITLAVLFLLIGANIWQPHFPVKRNKKA
jgi:hypothetical protein